jgi:WD40 repeat protein
LTALHGYDAALRAEGYDDDRVSAIAYSPDGRYVAIAGCTGATSGIRGVSPRKIFVCGASQKEGSPFILILDSGTEEVIANVPENMPFTSVTDLAFTHDGERLVYAMNPSKIGVWNLSQNRSEDALWQPADGSWLPIIALSPDDSLIAIMGVHSSNDGVGDELKVLNLATGATVLEAAIDGTRAWDLDTAGWHPYFSADGKRLFVPSLPDFILFDVEQGKEISRLASPCEPPCNVAVSPDLSSLAVMGVASYLFDPPRFLDVWDISTGERVRSLVDDVDFSGILFFTPDGRWLMQEGPNSDAGTTVWDAAAWQFVGRAQLIDSVLREVEFADDGSSFLIWGSSRIVLYGFETPAADLAQEDSASSSKGELEIPSGKLLLKVFDADFRFSRLEVLSLPDQNIEPYPLNLVEGTYFLYPSPDYRYWVLDQWITEGSANKESYYLAGPEIDKPVKIIEADGISGASWSLDSRLFAFGSTMDEGIRVYDVVTGTLKKLPIRVFNPNFPAFSPSGDRIAFGGGGENCSYDANGNWICDDGIFLINTDGSNEVRLGDGLFTHADTDIRWTPDGSSIFAESYGGMIKKFDVLTSAATLVSSESERASNPLPSPDGKYLAFGQVDEVTNYQTIHVIGIDPDRNLPERMVTGTSPVWSPDGKYLVYLSGDASATYVSILDIDSGKEVKVYTVPDSERKYPYGWLP